MEAVVARVRAYCAYTRTPKLLEVGCGTGMLARRLQTSLEYVGVDPVRPVVERLRAQVPTGTFEAMGAHEVPAHLYRGRVVLINSVIQYFPHEDYLVAFLRAARAGGAVGVFVGDVRCAELLSYQRVAFKQTRAPPPNAHAC